MTRPALELRTPLHPATVESMASPGVDSARPEPAVVGQADHWLQAHPSLTLCRLTSTLMEAPQVPMAVAPLPRNGWCKPSLLIIDKQFPVPIEALEAAMGQLEPECLMELDLALRGWLELP